MKHFLKVLVNYLIKHVKTYEVETFDTKNKTKSDLSILEKSVENKMKQLATKQEIELIRIQELVSEKMTMS